MSKSLLKRGVLAALTAAFLFSTSATAEFNMGGFNFMLGIKEFDNGADNNFDVLIGFLDLNATWKSENFEGKFEAWIFPAGYGGISFVTDATYNAVAQEVQTQKGGSTDWVIVNAYAKYMYEMIDVKIGRSLEKYGNGFFYGDYLQKAPGTAVDYPGVIQNNLQATLKTGPLSSTVLLGVGGPLLNKGYLLVREKITPIDLLSISLGYQGNIFDPIQDEDADVVSNLAFGASVNYMEGQKAFVELGIQGLGKDDPADPDETLDPVVPFSFGVTIPTGGVLSALQFEGEVEGDRAVPFQFGVNLVKSFNDHFIAITSISTRGNAAEGGDMQWAWEIVTPF